MVKKIVKYFQKAIFIFSLSYHLKEKKDAWLYYWRYSDTENSNEDKSTGEISNENNSTWKKLSIFKKTCRLVLSDS